MLMLLLPVLWCSPELILSLTPETRYVSLAPLRRAADFWQPYVGLPLLVFSHPHPPVDHIVPIQLGGHGYGFWWVKEAKLVGDHWCQTGSIRLGPRFDGLDSEHKAQLVAHELGHALGLPHRPGTIMDPHEWPGWIVSEEEARWLAANYPAATSTDAGVASGAGAVVVSWTAWAPTVRPAKSGGASSGHAGRHTASAAAAAAR